MRVPISLSLVAVACAGWAQCQSPGGGTTAPATPPATTPAASGATTGGNGVGPRPDWGMSNGPIMSQTVAITGRVLLAKNMPPPDPVAVIVVCNTPLSSWEGSLGDRGSVTDRQGRFSVVLGQMLSGTRSANGMSGLPRMGGCEAVIRVPGFEPFRKDLTRIVNLSGLDLRDILLKPSGDYGAGTVISRTSYSAPDAARKEYLIALHDAGAYNDSDALARLQKAVRLYPAYASAHYTMGQILDRAVRRDEAKTAYQKASEADANYVSPLLQLAQMAAEDRDWKTAAAQARRVVELSPSLFPDMYLILAGAQFNDGDLAAAEKSAREGLAASAASRLPRLHLLLAETLSRAKRFGEASEQYLLFATLVKDTPEGEAARTQALTMEKLARLK